MAITITIKVKGPRGSGKSTALARIRRDLEKQYEVIDWLKDAHGPKVDGGWGFEKIHATLVEKEK